MARMNTRATGMKVLEAGLTQMQLGMCRSAKISMAPQTMAVPYFPNDPRNNDEEPQKQIDLLSLSYQIAYALVISLFCVRMLHLQCIRLSMVQVVYNTSNSQSWYGV